MTALVLCDITLNNEWISFQVKFHACLSLKRCMFLCASLCVHTCKKAIEMWE